MASQFLETNDEATSFVARKTFVAGKRCVQQQDLRRWISGWLPSRTATREPTGRPAETPRWLDECELHRAAALVPLEMAGRLLVERF